MRRYSTGDGPSASETPIEDNPVKDQRLDLQGENEALARLLSDLAQEEGLSAKVAHSIDSAVQVMVRDHDEAEQVHVFCILRPDMVVMVDVDPCGACPAINPFWKARMAQIAGRK